VGAVAGFLGENLPEARAAAQKGRKLEPRPAAGVLFGRVDVQEVARVQIERAEGQHGGDDRPADLRAF